jgi:hypothetical protein
VATIQKIKIPAKTPTIIINGNGQRVWIQGGLFYLGGSDVNSKNGIFIKGDDGLIDLGNVAFGETIYAFSKRKNNIVTVLYYRTVL